MDFELLFVIGLCVFAGLALGASVVNSLSRFWN